MTNIEIARRVRARREYLWRQAGQHTQEFVAKRLGIERPSYTRWEAGATTIPAEALVRLADILQCDVADFYAEAWETGLAPMPERVADATESQRAGFSDDDELLDRLLIHQGKTPPTDPRQRELLRRALRGLADLADPLEAAG